MSQGWKNILALEFTVNILYFVLTKHMRHRHHCETVKKKHSTHSILILVQRSHISTVHGMNTKCSRYQKETPSFTDPESVFSRCQRQHVWQKSLFYIKYHHTAVPADEVDIENKVYETNQADKSMHLHQRHLKMETLWR